jgi:hypothetical protein
LEISQQANPREGKTRSHEEAGENEKKTKALSPVVMRPRIRRERKLVIARAVVIGDHAPARSSTRAYETLAYAGRVLICGRPTKCKRFFKKIGT